MLAHSSMSFHPFGSALLPDFPEKKKTTTRILPFLSCRVTGRCDRYCHLASGLNHFFPKQRREASFFPILRVYPPPPPPVFFDTFYLGLLITRHRHRHDTLGRFQTDGFTFTSLALSMSLARDVHFRVIVAPKNPISKITKKNISSRPSFCRLLRVPRPFHFNLTLPPSCRLRKQ